MAYKILRILLIVLGVAGCQEKAPPPKLVTDPSVVSPEVKLRCPLCGATFISTEAKRPDPRLFRFVCPKCQKLVTPISDSKGGK